MLSCREGARPWYLLARALPAAPELGWQQPAWGTGWDIHLLSVCKCLTAGVMLLLTKRGNDKRSGNCMGNCLASQWSNVTRSNSQHRMPAPGSQHPTE